MLLDEIKESIESSSEEESTGSLEKNKSKKYPKETKDTGKFSKDPKHQKLKVSLVRLMPADLMVVPVIVKGREIFSLIDTGATNNLIQNKIVKELGLEVVTEDSVVIRGLGKTDFKTLGRVKAEVDIVGMAEEWCYFDVVPDTVIEFDVIFGVQFLKECKLIIDIKRHRLSRKLDTGAIIYKYYRKDGMLLNVIEEEHPVYAAEDGVVVDREMAPLAITMNVSVARALNARNTFFFEGGVKNKKIIVMDGILEKGNDCKVMIQRNLEGNNNSRPIRIKKGDKIGKISTLIELEPDDKENEQLFWTKEELREKIDIGKEINKIDTDKIFEMLLDAQEAISKGETDIGKAGVSPHLIELTDKSPIWQKPRKFSEPVNQEIDKQCKELLDLDIIEYSNSQWAAPVVPVRKKDGQLRMCIDYRKLNSVTKTERFPMPNLSESIYSAHNTNFFTKLDLIKGYYQIPLDKNSREYTAFSTHHSHYQFKTLSFGLKNSGIAFQKNMQQILSEFCFDKVLVYIDDILIMSETLEEHLQLVGKVLNTLKNNGIKIKLSKCEFFKAEVSFLGHIIWRIGIRKSPEFIQKIKDYPKPKTVTELRQFLGLVNFQRKFISRCSEIGKPLSELTGGPKKKVITWTNEMDTAFDTLKTRLVEEVVLSFPDYSEKSNKLELFVDASGIGVGGCLVQKQNGEYRTIGYSSMTFSESQARYSTIERELVAIRWGVKTFRSFLFGVSFILYTDHKPLIYLHNMAKNNSRLMRTLTELSEYDFSIKYRPGVENSAADAMSRIVSEPSMEEYDTEVVSARLPDGLQILRTVEGGGDSFFISLLACLEDLRNYGLELNLPDSHIGLREELVTFLLENGSLFGAKLNKETSRLYKGMKKLGQLPCEQLFFVACRIYSVEIWVHHGMRSPVIYRLDKLEGGDAVAIIHLQCISGIHFNPVFSRRNTKTLELLVREKNINNSGTKLIKHKKELEHRDESDDETSMIINLHTATRLCSHDIASDAACIANVGNIKFCALLDTGAQVSLLSIRIYEYLKEEDNSLILEDIVDRTLTGINNCSTSILGYIKLKPKLANIEVKSQIPFAVVSEESMPCCCILGANFLSENSIIINFEQNKLELETDNKASSYPLDATQLIEVDDSFHRYNVSSFLGTVVVNSGEDSSENNSDTNDQDSDLDTERTTKVQYLISKESLVNIQNNDEELTLLKRNITENILINRWSESLQIFKYFNKKLRVQSDLLLKDGDASIPIVPLTLLIDILYKTHTQLAHVGMHKLVKMITDHFWHPSIEKVAHDICVCCTHCQLYKISSQPITPPTVKIHSSYPFSLVAMDLIQFPKSHRNNIAALVVVDHCSKFLTAIPIKDKRAATVSRALNEQVLPHILRIPDRILTDNGPEFRSQEFNQILDSYNITHIYSTRYHAAGNGAVERSNRTVTEFLKGLIDNDSLNWDNKLGKALIVYNNSWHSQINSTPSKYILQNTHSLNNLIPVHSETVENWKQAHPKFSSFKIGQQVAHKIQKIGNQVIYKLGKKYEGPFEIIKVQTNQVSYEMRDNIGRIHKVHHKQLKAWNTPPKYLENYLKLKHEITSDNIISNKLNSPDSSEDESDYVTLGMGCDSSYSGSSCSDSSSSNSSLEGGSYRNGDSSSDSQFSIYSDSSRGSDNNIGSGNSMKSNEINEFLMKKTELGKRVCSGKSRIENAVKSLSLENFHCTGPTSENVVTPVAGATDQGSTENHIINWSFEFLEESNLSENRLHEIKDYRCSSPIQNQARIDRCDLGYNLSPILDAKSSNSNLEIGRVKVIDKGTSTDIREDVIVEWIDQSLSIQRSILDILDEDIIDSQKSTERFQPAQLNIQIQPMNEESFHGFGQDVSVGKASSARLEALKSLRGHASYVRDSIGEYRRSSSNSFRPLWHKRFVPSDLGSGVASTLESEASDVITDLIQFNSPLIPSQRITRSRGTIEHYPNVQKGTLEYRVKKH